MGGRPHRALLAIVTFAWIVLIGAGVWIGFGYATTAGATGGTPTHWPDASELPRFASGLTIVMFVHPECPCTRASLTELAAAEAGATARFRMVIAFSDRTAIDDSASWLAAAHLGKSTRVIDHRGLEAGRFGALTSGYVVAYDATGALRFAGGVTGARGHVGDNVGRDQLARLLRARDDRADPTPAVALARHPVFGCALLDAAP